MYTFRCVACLEQVRHRQRTSTPIFLVVLNTNLSLLNGISMLIAVRLVPKDSLTEPHHPSVAECPELVIDDHLKGISFRLTLELFNSARQKQVALHHRLLLP
jgi:hypothetical protein